MEGTAQRLRDQKLFHPRIVNRSLEIIDAAVKDIDGFAEQLNIEISQKTIERARAWNELAGEAIVEVAGGAAANAVELGGKMADGAQAIGGAIADGAGTLGEAASKGIAELGAGASEGAKALGEALSNVDVSQVLDALPR